MPSPLAALITIWVAASELSSPGTEALAHTAQDTLGARAEIRVEAAARTDDADADALVRAGPTPAGSGVVELTWQGPNGARLRCYLPSARRWIDRSVTFSTDDPPAERGRTLGFLVASIFVEVPPARARPSPPPPSEKPPAPRKAEPARMGIAAALAAVGPGDGTSFGAHASFDYRFGGSLRLGVAGEGRFGTLPAAQATLRFLGAGVALTWEAVQPTAHSWLGPALGASVAELRITHLAAPDPGPASDSHVVVVLLPMLSGGVGIGGAAAAFLEGGVEFHTGRTTVAVGSEAKAEIRHFTPAGRLGLRTDF